MYDTSDRTVTSDICPSRANHSFGFTICTTSPVYKWLFYSILWNIMWTLTFLYPLLSILDIKSIKKEFVQYPAKWKPLPILYHPLVSKSFGHFLAYSITTENLIKTSQAFFTHSIAFYMQIKSGNGLMNGQRHLKKPKDMCFLPMYWPITTPLYPSILQLTPLPMEWDL